MNGPHHPHCSLGVDLQISNICLNEDELEHEHVEISEDETELEHEHENSCNQCEMTDKLNQNYHMKRECEARPGIVLKRLSLPK